MSILQIESIVSNVANAYDINYSDALSKTGITEESVIVSIEKLLHTINQELINSKKPETLATIW